jgi:Outer membrane protein beta-barrel domain
MLSRHHFRGLALAVAACAIVAWPSSAQAQADYDQEDGPALVFYAHGGSYSPLAHLDDDNNVDFQSGFSAGGGTAYRFNRYFALRVNFTFARAEAHDAALGALTPIAGNKFNRYLYDGDVQVRYPLRDGATPYAFIGGGGVTIQRDTVRNATNFTKGAGKVGLGLSYQLPKSDISVFVEGTGWIYRWDRYGFDNMQLDTTLSGGLSYRFGL